MRMSKPDKYSGLGIFLHFYLLPRLIKFWYNLYTISDFKIITTIKNSTKEDLTTDFIIQIFENEAYNKDTNTNYHVAGYEKMEVGGQYLLFLRHSITAENYIPMGIIFGKISIDEKESQSKFTLENTGSDVQHIQNLAREKYKNIK